MPTVTLDRNTAGALPLPAGKTGELYWDTETKGLGVRVRLDKAGKVQRSFVVQYRIGGQQRRQKLKIKVPDVDRARAKWLAMREGKIDEGIDPAVEKKVGRQEHARTFAKIVDEYLALKQQEVRAETYRLSKLYLTGDYFRALHAKPITKIELRDVSAALNAIRMKSGIPTTSQAQKHLSAFYVWSMQQGYALTNPVALAKPVKAGPPRDRVLSDDEMRRVWLACRDDDYGKVLRLLILSGCRCDEIGGLKWSEIDLDAGVINLPGERTKNGRRHVVPITDMMRDIIDTIPQRLNRDYLFGSRAEGFTSWNAKAELGDGIEEHWTPHDLRRTFRTGLGKLKIPPHVAELCVNHVKKGMIAVYDKYTYESEIAAAFAMWADHVQNIITGSERKLIPFPASA